jgi:hypothetical protein
VDLQGSYTEERPGMLARMNHFSHIAALCIVNDFSHKQVKHQ